MKAALVMFKIDGSRHDFPLSKSRVVVGRTVSCDLRVPLSSVSRQHCEIQVVSEDDGSESYLQLRDLGSSNGTFLNETRVQEAKLEPGDEITIGPVVFTLTIDGLPEEISPVRSLVQHGSGRAGGGGASDGGGLAGDGGGGAGRGTGGGAGGGSKELPKQDMELPGPVEAEPHTPTVQLDDAEDDDPITALEAMVKANDPNDSGGLDDSDRTQTL